MLGVKPVCDGQAVLCDNDANVWRSVQTNPHSANRSAKSGCTHRRALQWAPTNLQKGAKTQRATKTTVHATPASRASLPMNWRASSLHLPPVSRATTRRQLNILPPFSSSAREHTAPSILAAPGCAVPSAVRAHLSVISTANNGSPDARTSMALSSEPSLPRSCHVVLRCTALLHQPFGTHWPESSLASKSFQNDGSEKFCFYAETLAWRDTSSRPLKRLAPSENGGGPGQQRTTGSTTFFLEECSEEEAWCCQPCGHSRGSESTIVLGRNSWKHPQGPPPLSTCGSRWLRPRLWSIMCNASAHDDQHVAGAISSTPNRPITSAKMRG